MIKSAFFRSTVVILGLLLQFNVWAQTAHILHVETAGTLPALIADNEKYEITDLTLTGNLNGTDIRFIREMAGSHATNGKLSVLNLSGANIVSGGSDYYYLISDIYYTQNNSISDCMFDGCQLTNIILPNSVTKIGSDAFSYCFSLSGIYSKNPMPPNLGYECFDSVNKNTCKLYVPEGSKSAYQSASQWQDFDNIIEKDFTAINLINKENSTIKSVTNGISIETKETTPVSVYNLSGQKIYQSVINGNKEIRLNKGVYIVKMNNGSEKVIVK